MSQDKCTVSDQTKNHYRIQKVTHWLYQDP